MAIETIILVPSVWRRQRELLTQLEAISTATATGALSNLSSSVTDTELLAQITPIQEHPLLLGGTLYRANGELIGSFGELPQLTFIAGSRLEKLRPRGDRYDAPATAPALAQSHVLLVRHDAAGVRQELYWFVGRIAGLVLIIGVFVTLATMIVLEPTLITPILLLRNDLLRAGEAIPQDQEPQLYSPALDRRDELGFERPGKLIRVAVDVGDTVAAGTTLAALDTQSLRLQVQELDTQQTQAQSQLQELKAGPRTPTINAAQANVRGVQSQLNLAQQRSTRRQSLYAQGAISREQRDEALTQVSNLQAQVDEANSRLQELLAGGRPEQLRSQAARIEQLQVQEAQLATEQANSRLQAPFAGQIAARLADEGTVVTAGQPILRLVEAGPLEAQVGVRPRSGPTQTRQPPEASHR